MIRTLITELESRLHDPLAIFGLIMLAVIFALVAFIGHDNIKTQTESKTAALKKMPCPVCRGTTKTPDQAHDSTDIQFVECGRCSGDGTILMI